MITGVVLTKNEEKNISQCLDSLKWCDEIIVIDDYSLDKTLKIAKNRGARVFRRKLKANFSQQRNFALKKAKNHWVLFVDADERVSPLLHLEIVRRVKKAKEEGVNGFLFKRKDFFISQWLNHGETAQVKLLRLGKKSFGKWEGRVHEEWRIKGKKTTMNHPLLHYSHSNITDLLQKINYYTCLRAKEWQKKKESVSWGQIVVYPLAKFFKDYLFFQGFRDGTAGIIFALMMAFHSFLVRAKLWERKTTNT